MHPHTLPKAHIGARRRLIDVAAARVNEADREITRWRRLEPQTRHSLDAPTTISPHGAVRGKKNIGGVGVCGRSRKNPERSAHGCGESAFTLGLGLLRGGISRVDVG